MVTETVIDAVTRDRLLADAASRCWQSLPPAGRRFVNELQGMSEQDRAATISALVHWVDANERAFGAGLTGPESRSLTNCLCGLLRGLSWANLLLRNLGSRTVRSQIPTIPTGATR